jgi:OOP family OmpA-OmpF porin
MNTAYHPAPVILLTLLASTSLGVGAATQQDVLASPSTPRVEILGQEYQPKGAVSPQESQIIFYRGANGVQTSEANVYVDGSFHTALLPQAYTSICLTPGDHLLRLAIDDDPLYQGKTGQQFSVKLAPGQTYFLKVDETGKAAPVPMRRNDAEAELILTREQRHLISRVRTRIACTSGPVLVSQPTLLTQTPASSMPAPAPAARSFSIDSAVLFAFGKSDYRYISAEGKTKLREIITQIRNGNSSIDNIQIEGHADPIGTRKVNEKLAEARARSVKRFFVEQGLSESKVSAVGRGSENLVVQCKQNDLKVKIACHAPNRRAEIKVF